MRLTTHRGGRAALCSGGELIDVAEASGGRFGPDPLDLFAHWDPVVEWASAYPSAEADAQLGSAPPVPSPRQVFAIGLNYVDHAHESGMNVPTSPVVFTKFSSSLAGPDERVVLPDGNVDWEVELVAVVAAGGRDISEEAAWRHVAGLMVGQDLSERVEQLSGGVPQFSLAKSHRGFAPTGPNLVSVDEVVDRDDLELWCQRNGYDVQRGTTRDMIFPIPELIARLSRVVELFPGDLIFTGTPPGVGMGMEPPEFLAVGDVLVSGVTGIGMIRQTFTGLGDGRP